MPFHPLQEGIKGAWTYLVAMPMQFADNPLPVDGTLGGMMQNVDFPKAKKDFPSYGIHLRVHIMPIVDGYRSKVNPVSRVRASTDL